MGTTFKIWKTNNGRRKKLVFTKYIEAGQKSNVNGTLPENIRTTRSMDEAHATGQTAFENKKYFPVKPNGEKLRVTIQHTDE